MKLECETSFYNDEKLDTDLTHAQDTADEAKETAEEALEQAGQAANTAKNYLYESEDKGLVVSRTKVESDAQVEALTSPNSRVTATGFDVYRNGTTRVAHFGETTVIGEARKPQVLIENMAFIFTSSGAQPVFTVLNNVDGGSYASENLELNGEYLNTDGTINRTALANLIDTTLGGHSIQSAEGDRITTTVGAKVYVALIGYGMYDGVSTSDMTAGTEIACHMSLMNEAITATPISEIEPSDWYDVIDAFVALFPAGTTNYTLHLTMTLSYTISDAAMTLGVRVENQPYGPRSVSFGNGNIASGTGAVAIGRNLTAPDDYSLIIGEDNVDIQDPNTGDHMPTAFAVGAGGSTPFAVLKSGIICMSAANSGVAPQRSYPANSKTDVQISFPHEYPSTPFIFLTLNEDDIPTSAISDYSRVQIFLQSVDTTGFTASIVNGGSHAHTFSFNWFAISVM